jgi:RHS repeat-associated protein
MRHIILTFITFLIVGITNIGGQTTVDYLTGAANVNFPLYNLKGHSKNFPVSLSYNTSGIKVNDISSEVGLGWQLSGLGKVTRSLQGMPDETPNGIYIVDLNGSLVFQPKENYGGYMRFNEQDIESLPRNSIVSGEIDMKPDEFYVQAPGLEAKFLFGRRNGVLQGVQDDLYQDPVVCLPMQDIEISYIIENNKIVSFLIVNDEGFTYQFDQANSVFIHTDCANNDSYLIYNFEWYLTSIKNPHGQIELQIEYTKNETESAVHFASQTGTRSIYSALSINASSFLGSAKVAPPVDQIAETCDIIQKTKLIRIASMQTVSEKLSFIYNDNRLDMAGDKMLNQLLYESKLDDANPGTVTIGKCVLNHEYFHSTIQNSILSSPPAQDSWRLKLVSVQFTSAQNTALSEPTIFEYENLVLPIRNSLSQDHWGYYNAANNQSLIYRYKFLSSYDLKGAALREAGGAGCRLMKIHFADGGVESFEFERHFAGKIGNDSINRFENVQILQPELLLEATVGHQIAEDPPYDPETNAALNLIGMGNHVGYEEHSNQLEFVIDQNQEVTLHFNGYYEQVENFQNLLMNNFAENTEYSIEILDANQQLIIRWILPKPEPYSNGDLELELQPGTYYMKPFIKYTNGHPHIAKILCNVRHYKFENATIARFVEVGGNRVKKITYDDGDADQSNNLITNYQYYDGVLYSAPDNRIAGDAFCSFRTESYLHSFGNWHWQGYVQLAGEVKLALLLGASKKSSNTVNGSHMGYSAVREIITDENMPSGYTLYKYDLSDLPVLGSRIGTFQDLKTWRLKALRSIEHYDIYNRLVSATTYEYKDRNGNGAFDLIGLTNNGTHVTVSQHIDVYGIPVEQSESILWHAGLSFVGSSVGLFRNPTPVGVAAAIIGMGTALYTMYMAAANPTAVTNAEDPVTNFLASDNLPVYYENEYYNLSKIKQTQIDPDNPLKYLVNIIEYEYAPLTQRGANQAVKIKSSLGLNANDPNPQRPTSRYTHPGDYNIPITLTSNGPEMAVALQEMVQKNDLASPVEILEGYAGAGSNDFITGGTINMYKLVNGEIQISSVFQLNTLQPIPVGDFEFSWVDQDGVFHFDSRYTVSLIADKFDSYLSPDEFHHQYDIHNTIIRDGIRGQVTAVVTNAAQNEVAFTSFECHLQHGGWIYDEGAISQQTNTYNEMTLPIAKTGRKYFDLTNGFISTSVPAGEYTLSFWASKNVNVQAVQATSITLLHELDLEVDERGWTYFEYLIIGQNAMEIKLLQATDKKIDELRLYPSDAMMSTRCFNPEGTINTTTDANNYSAYFFYDEFYRKNMVLDHHWNIRSLKEFHARAGSNDHTWMESTFFTDAFDWVEATSASGSEANVLKSKTFMDGLRRPIQTIGYHLSPSNKDVIAYAQYDKYGRSPRSFMPYVKNNPGHVFRSNAATEQLDFYQSHSRIAHTEFPFSDVVFEKSPLGKVVEAGSVGQDWQLGNGHTIKQKLTFNDLNEVLRWNLTSDFSNAYASVLQGGILKTNYWPENSLIKVQFIDENGKKGWSYYDVAGKLVMKREIVDVFGQGASSFTAYRSPGRFFDLPNTPASRNLDTYYVYDPLGRLVYELPPVFIEVCAESASLFRNIETHQLAAVVGYTYENHYDSRGRLIESRAPGEEPVYYIYDKIDQLVLSQDGLQRLENKWSFMKYDILGRPVVNGTVVYQNTTAQDLRDLLANPALIPWEKRYNGTGNTMGYSNNTFVNTNFEIWNTSYYDNYDFDSGENVFDLSEVLQGFRIRGIETGNKTLVLNQETDNYLISTNYFNRDLRLVQNYTTNMLGGWDKYYLTFDYGGKLINTIHNHQLDAGGSGLMIKNRFEYDRTGRFLRGYQQTGNDPEILMTALVYNDLSQVYKKHLHIPAGQNTGMQVVDFRYNERGWLRKINNSNLVDDGDNEEDFDVFGIELEYTASDHLDEDNFSPFSSAPSIDVDNQYNGLLSAVKWNSKAPDQNGSELQEHAYTYHYDDRYHLIATLYARENHELGTYGEFRDSKNSRAEVMDYDLNGNITKLQRNIPDANGAAQVMDKLEYTYASKSNKLIKVEDQSQYSPTFGITQFVDGTNMDNDYEYDVNGQMTRDKNKMLHYTFNALGLMSKVTKDGNSDECSFVYAADGTLLAKKSGTRTTWYISGAEYEQDGTNDPVFKQMATAEGILRPRTTPLPDASTYVYDYYIKDHLGNLRVVITEEGSTDKVEKATVELEKAAQEEIFFEHLPNTRFQRSTFYPSAPGDENQKVSRLDATSPQGPSRILAVNLGDEVQIDATAYWQDTNNGQNGMPVNQIMATMLSNLINVGQGTMPPGETGILQFNDPNSAPNTVLTQFMSNQINQLNPNRPQAYLVYLYLDENLMVNANYSGIVPVTDPAEVRTLQSPPLLMPGNGYLYTFLTNSSQTMVEFNDLTIRHKQGVILAHYDYYAYGLMWSDPEAGNIHDQTYQSREWNQNEFGDSGMDLYRFEARMYDPVIGRWTSLDPAQQFFNNYIAMSNDPANHVDLDGRWSWDCFTEGFAGLNKSGVFNGIGDMLSVYSAAKSIQSLSQVSDASISLGMSTALTNAKAVLNQVATAMAGGGVADGVSGQGRDQKSPEMWLYIGHATGRAGEGTDWEYGYNGDINTDISKLKKLSNNELLSELEDGLTDGTVGPFDDEAQRLMDHYRKNSGETFYWDNAVKERAMDSQAFTGLVSLIENELSEHLKRNNGSTEGINIIVVAPSFSDSGGNLKALIGGTQGVNIWLQNIVINADGTYTADITIQIEDDFALSNSDVTNAGPMVKTFAMEALKAQWILQHQRGYKPFKTSLNINVQINGKL